MTLMRLMVSVMLSLIMMIRIMSQMKRRMKNLKSQAQKRNEIRADQEVQGPGSIIVNSVQR